MPSASVSHWDLIVVMLLLAIPLGFAALAVLFTVLLAVVVAVCAAAEWALRRANRVVLSSVGEN